jgi:hypothetical protein
VLTRIGDLIHDTLPPSRPVDANLIGSALNITARNIGSAFNGRVFSLKYSSDRYQTSGLFAITEFSGGTGYPTDLTNIFNVVGDRRYNGVGWPEGWAADLDILERFLEDRFNTPDDILRGVGFIGRTDTYAQNLAYVTASNSRVIYYVGNNWVLDSNGGGYRQTIISPADYIASYFMGVRSRRLTPGAQIADNIISTVGRDDSRGGPHMASLPYFNTPIRGAVPGDASEQYSASDQDGLATAGFTVFGNNPAGTGVIMGRVVCPYKTDSSGNSNISFHKLNYFDIGDVCSEILQKASKARFSQSRLTSGDTIPGYSMENAATIKAHYMSIYRILADNVLVVKGPDAEKYVSDNLDINIDIPSGKVTVYSVLPIVVGLEEVDYTLQYSFGIGEGQQITF